MENSNTTRPQISVIIVSYNCLHVLRFALDTLRQAMRNVAAEVIVVDNASADGTADFLRGHYPWVRLLEHSNDGFGVANNVGIAAARGRIIVLLNPDTIVPRTLLADVADHFERHPGSGAMGVRMINGRGRFLRESKRGYPSVGAAFFKVTGLWKLNRRSATLNAYYLGNISEFGQGPVPSLPGAFMAFEASILERTQAFDENYFMYFEDTDLSWRMHNCSTGNIYRGDITIVHFKGESTPARLFYIRHFYNALRRFAACYETPRHGALVNALTWVGIRMWYAVRIMRCLMLQVQVKTECHNPRFRKIFFISRNTDNPPVIQGTKATCTCCCDLHRLPQRRSTLVVFDISGDLKTDFDTMNQFADKMTFGFFNPETRQTLVFHGTSCIVL